MHSYGREQRSIFLQVRLLLIFLGRLNEEKNLDMTFHLACKPEAMVLVETFWPIQWFYDPLNPFTARLEVMKN